jgi:long-chain acyl-CoA synthetase
MAERSGMTTTSPDQATDCVSAIEHVARRNPDRVAVIDAGRATSYRELQALIVERTVALHAAGLKPGHRVTLIAESSTQYLVTALAVWRAGGVLVTVYPSSGQADLQHAVETSDPALIVVDSGVDRSAVSSSDAPVADIEAFRPTRVKHDVAPNPTGLREPLKLICFSSGTTSRPKAIMITAKALHNLAITYGEVWHLSSQDRGIVCLPMAWLYGLGSTSLAILVRGGTVIVVRRARADLLAQAISELRATFLAGVTTTFVKLVQYTEQDGVDSNWSQSLRLCVSGGEPRNEGAFARFTALTGLQVFDAYCASECLPLVAYDPRVDPVPRPGAAGRLVPRSQLRIVDPTGADVPRGEIGEALTTGPGLMLGYWRDEEATRAALTDDGWYRTKGLVRMDEDGYVYVVGRLSDLIIRGGINISPAEVERALREHAKVEDVAVVGVPDDVYGQRVVAAVVPASPIDEAELRAFAAANLTSYKAPSDYLMVETLPVNSTTGKVNRREVAALFTRG